jgi:sensor domain DACNG-containing protein
MNEIRLFVSGYECHFLISARHAAEALFRALDKELHVELFLVGIFREDTTDRHPVCLEPEDCRGQSGKPGDTLAPDGAAVARPASDPSFVARGDPRGGARYNASVRYVSGKPHCLAVVILEDFREWLAVGANLADRGAGGQ